MALCAAETRSPPTWSGEAWIETQFLLLCTNEDLQQGQESFTGTSQSFCLGSWLCEFSAPVYTLGPSRSSMEEPVSYLELSLPSLSSTTGTLCPLAWSEAGECQLPAVQAVLPSTSASCGLHGKSAASVRRPWRGGSWYWVNLHRGSLP